MENCNSWQLWGVPMFLYYDQRVNWGIGLKQYSVTFFMRFQWPRLSLSHLISSKFNLSLIGTFTWPTPPGPYRATTCRERKLNYGSHNTFLTTQGYGGPPGWVISPMPGPPPRQHVYERQYTLSTHSVIPTRRIWNDDYDGQMIFGDPGGLQFPDIRFTGEENPRKNLTQETCPDRRSNPGSLRDKRACYHLRHRGGRVCLAWIKTSELKLLTTASVTYTST